MAVFAVGASPANASMILGVETYSAPHFNPGWFDSEFESSGWGANTISSNQNLPEPGLPKPLWVGDRLSGQEAAPVSSSMGGCGTLGAVTNGSVPAVMVLHAEPFCLPSSLLLNWLIIEHYLDVPAAPTFELLRPPQILHDLV